MNKFNKCVETKKISSKIVLTGCTREPLLNNHTNISCFYFTWRFLAPLLWHRFNGRILFMAELWNLKACDFWIMRSALVYCPWQTCRLFLGVWWTNGTPDITVLVALINHLWCCGGQEARPQSPNNKQEACWGAAVMWLGLAHVPLCVQASRRGHFRTEPRSLMVPNGFTFYSKKYLWWWRMNFTAFNCRDHLFLNYFQTWT